MAIPPFLRSSMNKRCDHLQHFSGLHLANVVETDKLRTKSATCSHIEGLFHKTSFRGHALRLMAALEALSSCSDTNCPYGLHSNSESENVLISFLTSPFHRFADSKHGSHNQSEVGTLLARSSSLRALFGCSNSTHN